MIIIKPLKLQVLNLLLNDINVIIWIVSTFSLVNKCVFIAGYEHGNDVGDMIGFLQIEY